MTLKFTLLFMFFFLFPNYMDASWKVQFENTTYGFYGVDFVDTLHGWVVGGGLIHCPGVILKTKNGGINWDWTYTEYRLNGVCFIDNIYGWVVGDSGTILYTNDSGDHWQSQKSGTVCFLCDVEFVDNLNGWVVGDSALILHTSNGGENWEIQNRSDNPSRLLSVEFVNENIGWATGDFPQIYYTTNGGDTWNTRDLEIGAFSLKDIQFLDSLNGWIATGESIYCSADGGSTWVFVDSNFSTTGLYFSNKKKGWVVGSYDISHTCDAGSTWTTEMSPGLAWLIRVVFIDTTHGWTVGYYPLSGNEARGEILRYFPTGVEEAINETEKVIFVISPNPVSGKLRIHYTLPQASKVTLKLYNAVGRVAKTRFTKHQEPGIYNVELDMRQLPSGIYFLKFTAGDFTQTQKLILIR